MHHLLHTTYAIFPAIKFKGRPPGRPLAGALSFSSLLQYWWVTRKSVTGPPPHLPYIYTYIFIFSIFKHHFSAMSLSYANKKQAYLLLAGVSLLHFRFGSAAVPSPRPVRCQWWPSSDGSSRRRYHLCLQRRQRPQKPLVALECLFLHFAILHHCCFFFASPLCLLPCKLRCFVISKLWQKYSGTVILIRPAWGDQISPESFLSSNG